LLRPAALVTFSSSEQAAAAATATAAVTPLTTLVMLYSDYLDLAVYVHPRAAEKQNKTADGEEKPAAELVASAAPRAAGAEAKSAMATRRFVKDVTEDEREIVCGTLTDNRQLPEKKGKNKKGAVAAVEKSVPAKNEKKQPIEKSKKEQPKKEQPKVWMEHNIWRSFAKTAKNITKIYKVSRTLLQY
jgi:pyruvate/2-oxoglutarate dehydrogenase complex dihydrolipoamide acyltransferase (E2) component